MGKPTDIPVYYKSDFDFILQVFDKTGKEVFVGDMDFIASFRTFSLTQPFVASRERGQLSNCFIEPDGRIHVVAKDHGLPPGQLKCELLVRIPDSIYPDGMRKDFTPGPVGICLTEDAGGPAIPLKACLTTIWVNAGTNGTLPFVFEEKHKDSDMETVYYDRGTGVFYRGGEVIPASEGTYNETAIDGMTRASTTSEFRCGQTVYRHTGRELVNTAIERNPNQRLVHHVPTLSAHPGLAYLDRGFINVTGLSGLSKVPRKVSLRNMWFADDGWRVPLSDLTVHCRGVEAHIEGDDLILEAGDGYDGNNLCGFVQLEFGLNGTNTFIGVRYTSGGDKIFYRAHGVFPVCHPMPTTVCEAARLFEINRGNGYCFSLIQRDFSGGTRIEVWKRANVLVGVPDDEGARQRCQQWRWRKIGEKGTSIHGKTCLLRVSRRVGAVWSDWAYFHVTPFAPVNLRKSRQRRT